MKIKKNSHFKLKLCVSGAAETGHCGPDSFEKAEELGRQIALQDAILTTGATTGFPFQAAKGAKSVDGISIGFSPASTEYEHTVVYRLPTDYLDLMVYTGFGFPGRDLFLTRASDAVLIGCGRIGTIHEFTVAFEDKKPVGILEGSWDMDETIKLIIERAHRPNDRVIFDSDPKALVERVIELVKEDKAKIHRAYKNDDLIGGTGNQEIIM
jgi:hypothetical protein